MRFASLIFTMPAWLFLGSCSSSSSPIMPVPIKGLGQRYHLVSSLGVPLGQKVRVEGFVVEEFYKSAEAGANLYVQRINGRGTQEGKYICLTPVRGEWNGENLPFPQENASYEMEGYVTGSFAGLPDIDNLSRDVQCTGFHFSERLAVYKSRRIDRIEYGPGDFPDRKAFLRGTARSASGQATLAGPGWSVVIDPRKPWDKDVEGKPIETYGQYAPAGPQGRYRLSDGWWTLVRLEDQVGRQVALHGYAWSRPEDFENPSHWWFVYRGQELWVENMDKLPGWNTDLINCDMIMRGVLGVADRTDNDRIKFETDKKKYFIVRNASWERTDRPKPPREWLGWKGLDLE